MKSEAFELTTGNERLRHESIYQPRESAHLEKKIGNHLSGVESIGRILRSATKDLPSLASREDRRTICPALARTF